MLIFSHRGYHARARENTLDAFAEATALGVDGIETDVRITREGTAVLFHNRSVDSHPVAALTATELDRLAGCSVPTLESALDAFPSVVWNLEIKLPAAVEATVSVLRRFRASRRILISSFWHPVVEDVCTRLDVDGAVLVAHCPLANVDPRGWLPKHARVNAIVWDCENCNNAAFDRAAAAGISNFVYGADSLAELNWLGQSNVTGVITDHPEYLKPF